MTGKSILKYTSLLIFLLFFYTACVNKPNPKLMVPDCCGGGYNLTSLGSLVYGPWEADLDGYNEKLYISGKEVLSVGRKYTKMQANLVFELLQDGSMQYWFKSDYDSSLTRRLTANEKGVKMISKGTHNKQEIKRKYKSGRWEANYTDSTLLIDFGIESPGIPALKGKYVDLGSNLLMIRQTSIFDSVFNGKHETVEKVATISYTHPWINDL